MSSNQAAGKSIRERFTSLIEKRIISGELAVGQRLPPERELAEQTGISRTIVHAGLVELAAKKVLRVAPRKGVFVADYRKEASLEIYNALIQYSGAMDENLFENLVEFRMIMETNCARLAALNATGEDVETLRQMLEAEKAAVSADQAVELDYELHVLIASATKNIILPMAMHSMEKLYKALAGQFYSILQNRKEVYTLQDKLIEHIARKEPRKSAEAMEALLEHGLNVVKQGMDR